MPVRPRSADRANYSDKPQKIIRRGNSGLVFVPVLAFRHTRERVVIFILGYLVQQPGVP